MASEAVMSRTAVGGFRFYLVIFAVISTVRFVEPRSISLPGGSCVESCPPGANSSPLKYQVGRTYTYDMEGTTTLSIPVNSDKQNIKMKGQVKLVVISPCEGAILLENFQPIDADGEGHAMNDLETHPMRFSWNGGKVEHICPDAADVDWVVNIKRAALSALQNSLDSFDSGNTKIKEVDISGECETDYVVSFGWTGKKVVKKTKDLLKCQDRSGYNSFIQADKATHGLSEINNLPLLRSEHSCEHEINDEKVISKSTCNEIHAYKPFIKYGKGPEVSVKLTLELVGSEGSSALKGSGSLRQSCLRFHHKAYPKVTKNWDSKAEDLVTRICKASNGGLEMEVPDLSYELIYSMRKMSKDQLVALREKIKSGQICEASKRMENFFTELLPQAGGAGAIGLMAQIIKQEKPGDITSKSWEVSLAFSRRPDPESITAAMPLLEGKPCATAMLAVSALAHSYCRENEQCQEEAAVKALISNLNSQLGTGCKSTDEEHKDRIIAALKAFGNLGRADTESEKNILSCAANRKLNPSIRTAAIDAFRRMPCSKPVKTELLNILSDVVDDSDIRIKAYQILMGCPCGKVVNQISDLLNRQEESKQVTSYIRSHLRNIQHSAAPTKSATKKLVENIDVKEDRHSSVDFLKESHNFETSYFNKYLGLGAMAESNLIFSQKSYIPRAFNFNATLELFGVTSNIFEIGGRIESAEKGLEDIFGPGGTLRESVEDLKEMIVDKFEDLKDKAGKAVSAGRSKRSVITDQSTITNQINEGHGPHETYGREPSGDVYIRVFGNELIWFPMNDDKLEKAAKAFETSAEKKLQNTDVLTSWNLLQPWKMTIPTVTGLPIRLFSNITASAGFTYEESNAKFDFPDASLKLKMTPSIVIGMSSTMVVDAYTVKRGVKITSYLKSSPSVDFDFQATKNGVNAKFNLPKGDMDLFKATLQSYFMTKTADSVKLTPIVPKKSNERSIDSCVPAMGKALGVKLCFSGTRQVVKVDSIFELPEKLLYPAHVAFTLKREDTGIKAYELVGKWKLEGDEPELSLYADTPGSKDDRKIGFSVAMKKGPERKYEVFFNTPLKKMSARVDYIEDPNLRRFGAKLQYENDVYSVNVQSGIITAGDTKTYTPMIEYTTPTSGTTKVFQGRIVYTKDKALDFEFTPLSFEDLAGASVEGSFAYEVSGDKKEIDIKKFLLNLPDHKVSTTGSLKLDKPNYAYDLATEFGSKTDLQNIKVNGKLVDNSKGDYAHVKGNFGVESSIFKDVGAVDVETELKKEPGHFLADLVITHGANKDKFTFHEDLKYSGLASLSSLSFDGTLKMAHKPETDGFDLLHTASFDSNHFHHVWNLGYHWNGEKKQIESRIDLEDKGTVEKADLSLKALLSYPGKKYEYSDEFKETEKGVYSGNSELIITPGDTYKLKTDIVDKQTTEGDKDSRTNIQKFDVVLTSTGWQFPVEVGMHRNFKPGVVVYDARVKAENENKLLLENKWTLNDKVGKSNTHFDLESRLFIIDVIDSHVTLKYDTPERSINAHLEFPKLKNRRIELSGSVVDNTGDQKTVTAELLWDAKNDATKKLSLNADVTLPKDKWEVQAKNRITYIDDRYDIDYKLSLAKKWDDGTSGGELEITFPSKKTFYLKDYFTMHRTKDTYNNDVLFNLKTLDDDYYKFEAKTNVRDKNYDDLTGKLKMDMLIDTPWFGGNFDITSDRTKTGKAQEWETNVKFQQEGQREAWNYRGKLGLEPKKMVSLGLKLARGKNVYIDTDLHAKFDLDSKVKVLEYGLNFKAPEYQVSAVAVDSKTETYFSSWDDAKTSHKTSLVVGGSSYVVVDEFLATKTRISGTSTWDHDKNRMSTVTYSVDKETPNVYLGKLEVNAMENKITADVELRNQEKWKKVGYSVQADLMMLGFESTNHKLLLEKNGDLARFESDAMMDGEQLYDAQGELLMDKKAPFLKASLTLPSEDPMTLEVRFEEKGPSAYAIDGKANWSKPKGFLNFMGEAKFTAVPLSFDVKAEIDSPAFDIEKWRLVGKSKLEGDKRQIRFKADNKKEKDLYVLKMTFTDGENSISGNGNIKIRTYNSTFDFSLPKEWVDQDLPASITIKSVGESGEMPREIVFKREKKDNYKEIIYSLDATMKKTTYSLQAKIYDSKPDSGVDGKITFSFKGKTKRRETSYETVAALSTQNEALKAELVSNQLDGDTPKKFGFKVDAKDGKFQTWLYILERVLHVDDEWHHTHENGRERMSFVGKLWVDEGREPDQVLTISANIREEEALKGQRWTGSFVTSHPALKKDLKINTELILHGEKHPFYYKADFDVYGNDKTLQVSYASTNEKLNKGWVHRCEFIAVRPGDIDVRALHEYKKTDDVYTADFKISAGNSQRGSSAVESHLEVDVGNEKLLYTLKGPGQFLEIERIRDKTSEGADEMKSIWTLKQTDSVPIKAEVIRSTDISLPAISIQVYDSDKPDKRLRFRAGYASPKMLNAKLDSVDGGKETLYFQRTIELRPDNVLSHKMSWRKENFRGLWEGVKYRAKMVGEHVFDGITSAHQLISDWRASYRATGRLEPAFDPLGTRLKEEIDEFVEEIEMDPTFIMAQSFLGIDDIRTTIEDLVESFKKMHEGLLEFGDELLSELEESLGTELGFKVSDIHNWIDRSGDELEKLWHDFEEIVQNLIDEFKSGKEKISFDDFLDFLDRVLDRVKAIFDFVDDFVKEFKEEYKIDQVIKDLEQFQDGIDQIMGYFWKCRYFRPIKEFYDEAKKWFRDEFKVNRDKLNEVWKDVVTKSNDAFEESGGKFVVWEPEKGEIEVDIPVPASLSTLQLPLSPVQKFFESLDTTGITQTFWDAVAIAVTAFEKIEFPKLDKTVNEVYPLIRAAISFFDPDNLRSLFENLSASSPLSGTPLGFLTYKDRWVKYSSSDEDSPVRDRVKEMIEMVEDGLKMLDQATSASGYMSLAQSSWLNEIVNGLGWINPFHVMPPYKASAYIIGQDKFISFDRKVHNFAGKCKYLLARENSDGMFSLEADYTKSSGRSPTKSLIFSLTGDDGTYSSIEIGSDYSVKLDGQPANPPFKTWGVWVTRESPEILQVNWEKEGVALVCNTHDDFCRLRVSGWYHGRVGGLLGSNDRESVNDMVSPSGEKIDNVATLASKWISSPGCTDKPLAFKGPGLPACGKIFRDDFSPLKGCFKKVDPEPFRKACMELSNKNDDGLCDLVRGYRMACFEKGKIVEAVEECKKCDFDGRKLIEGSETEVKTTSTADVVIVVNQIDCLKNLVKVDELVSEIKSQAKDLGISNMRFGVVGYGNKDIDKGNPTILTTRGNVWTSGEIPGFDLNGDCNSKTLKALLMAASFDFRPEATKSIVLLTCKPCERTLEDLFMGNYYKIEKELLLHGITLHSLTSQDITVKTGKKKVQKQVIGADSKAVYKINALKDKEFKPDAELRAEVQVEPDYCTQLAQTSHGSVFSLARLQEVPEKSKQFRQVFARKVAESLGGESIGVCQKCKCEMGPWDHPEMHCELCNPLAGDLSYREKDLA